VIRPLRSNPLGAAKGSAVSDVELSRCPGQPHPAPHITQETFVTHVSRRTVAVLAAAVSLGGAISVGQAATASAATWASTATKAVTFTGPKLGSVPAAQTLHLSIALAPRNASAMNAATRALYTPGSATYHQYLTPAQWAASYAPTTADVAKVTSYLQSEGFTNVQTMGDRLLVTADATAAQAEKAFNTSLVDFTLGSNTVYGNTAAAQVPASLSGIVSAVVGLNNLPLNAVKPTVKQAGSPDLEGGLFPAQFKTTYDTGNTPSGKNISIAILTEGSTTDVISSLRYAEAQEHEAQVPVSVVKVGAQSTDTAGADEFDMDSQVSTGVADTVKRLYMYNIGSLVDAQIDADFAKFVSDDKATALSASIGGCEINSYLDGSEVSTDVVMQEGAMQGQSLFASSGDNGDACMYVAAIGAPVGVPGVNWPASGEFNTAVGGTSLVTDDQGNRIQELAWVGSGGGISSVENPGWWTQDSDPAFDSEYVSGGRAVPDVSLDADPNVATPAIVYVGKTVNYVGGTSLSSPMMLGFWARLQAAHGNKLGLASIPLYQVSETTPVGLTQVIPSPDPAPVPGFTDITVGDNGVYPATPGYDEATGLGAPDVAALSKVIK
jgi:subtilase family serine protease